MGIICGDLNAHHKSWKSKCRNNKSGNYLFTNLNLFPHLSLLNSINFETRTDPHSGKTSNIDHIIATSPYHNKKLSIGANLVSDHSIIIMEDQSKNTPHLYFRSCWAFKAGTGETGESHLNPKKLSKKNTH